VVERVGRDLQPGIRFQDDVVLVELREDRGDLTLAERVVERVVDHLRRDAQAGGNKVQRVVQVRQMNARQVMDERTLDFRGAHAAV